MSTSVRFSAATIAELANSLSKQQDESFILIYLDQTSDEWVVELSENLDGLLVANLFNVFQGRLLESLLQQKQAFLAEATADVEPKKSSA